MSNFQPTVIRLRELADEIEIQKNVFEIGGVPCECCGSFRYSAFPQRIIFRQIEEVAKRLRGIAGRLEVQQNDREFYAKG